MFCLNQWCTLSVVLFSRCPCLPLFVSLLEVLVKRPPPAPCLAQPPAHRVGTGVVFPAGLQAGELPTASKVTPASCQTKGRGPSTQMTEKGGSGAAGPACSDNVFKRLSLPYGHFLLSGLHHPQRLSSLVTSWSSAAPKLLSIHLAIPMVMRKVLIGQLGPRAQP